MLHRILLVFTLLVAVSCTGDDTVRVEVETKIQCPNNGPLISEGETCPPVTTTPTMPTTTPTTPDPDTDRGAPTRSDCNIHVQGVNLDGTNEADVICGNDRGNTIKGLAGDDTIYGGPGNDTLIGGDDRDVLRGEAGDDILRGGQDNDILDGGAGMDTADYSMENLNMGGDALEDGTPVEVNLAEGQATDTYKDNDTLISIENVIGTVGNDNITGDNGNNEIDGNGGADTLDGGAGSDTIVVTAAFDLDTGQGTGTTINNFENIKARGTAAGLALAGNSKRNKLTANDAGNTLTGEGGDDELIGGQGVDNLIGGSGRDTLTGGGGTDCFQLDVSLANLTTNREMAAAISSTTDRITDYEEGETINVVGATEPASALGTRTIIVEVENGRVVVVLSAVPADSGVDPAVPAQGAQKATLATGSNIVLGTATATGTCS